MQKKVLITSRTFGQISEEPIKILKKSNIIIDFQNLKYDPVKFMETISEYDAIIIGSHNFTREAMKKASKLKIICKHGVGVDNIDLATARELGICVTNVPGVNANAVADLTFGLILDVARKISYSASEVKKGNWNRIIGTDVCFKTLGIIGLGAIGKNVARRAQSFNMDILAYDPFITEISEELPQVKMMGLDEVIRQSDFLTIHTPLNDNTKHLIGKEQIASMKKGSFLFNTSRGGIVDESALYDSIKNGNLAGAGLDVTEKEPPIGSPLLKLDNVTIVPHIGMYSKEAINKVSVVCANNIVKIFSGEIPENVVTQ